jgi:hypothetical protein
MIAWLPLGGRTVRDAEERGAGELLSAVIGNVLAVPLVLGLIALGGAVIVSRSLADFVVPRGKRRPRRKQPARHTESSTVR